MDASLLQTQEAPRGFQLSKAVKLALAASAAVALTVSGVSFLKGAAPSLKGHVLYAENPKLGEAENVLAVRFENFMQQYGKVYASNEEQALRFEVFKSNARFIKEQNAQGFQYTLGENQFMDLTHEEFKLQYLGLDKQFFQNYGKNGDVDTELLVDKSTLPATADWREKGCVTEVKNQGQCGSCWAFSATGSLEGAYCAAGLGTVDLSEQQLVDCARKEGNAGCRGGLMTQAYQYVLNNKGLCAEKDYPYTAMDGTCKASKCKPVIQVDSFFSVPKENEDALMAGIVKRGPIAVAIQADQRPFQFYKSGVFTGSCGTNLDHGVLAVGYGSENGQDYYIVKNSWGAGWGDKGYIKLGRGTQYNGGNGQCGVQMWPVFAKVN